MRGLGTALISTLKHVITVRNVFKVFGNNVEESLELAQSGMGKTDIQNKTGGVAALMDVSFNVNEGEFFVIMGLSGSGKSTAVRSLNRLLPTTSGSIKVYGEEISTATARQMRELRRTKISMVFQHFGLMPHRTVEGNVKLGLELRGEGQEHSHELIANALELVGLTGWEESYPRHLSGGMRQRVGIARALAQDTPIMLMDEPFSGLDPLIRREMQDELLRLQSELHKTIVFVTHDLDEAIKVGDRIAIMRDGEIVQIGTPQKVVRNPANNYVSDFTKGVRLEDILMVKEVMVKPRAVVPKGASLKTAMLRMQHSDSPVVIVIDDEQRYVATLTLDLALEAWRKGKTEVEECCDGSQPAVISEEYLKSAVGPLLASPYLLPVVEQNSERLVGELHRPAIATILMSEIDAPAEDINKHETDFVSLAASQHEALSEMVGNAN